MEVNIPEPEMTEISKLKPDPMNIKKPSEDKKKALIKSITKFGYLIPIITNKDYLIADGHQRLSAAKEMGMKKVPVIKLDVNEVDRKLLRQTITKLQWDIDPDLDFIEIKELVDSGNSVELAQLIDANPIDFEKLIEQRENIDEDDFQIPKEAKYKIERGEIWQLGDHRLMCGDATCREDVDNLMGGGKADMVFTDPPYGVDYASKNRFLNRIAPANRIEEPILNDNIEDYYTFFSDFIGNLVLNETNSIYVTISGQKLLQLLQAFKDKDFKMSQLLVWVKNNHVLGRQDYSNKHELIWYGWKGKHKYYGGFDTTTWEIKKPQKSELHPTMKPIPLIDIAIVNSSQKGQIVLDLFGGSGSTLIACEQRKRKCYMMEIDPYYCSVIIERWEKFTNKKAEKVTDNEL